MTDHLDDLGHELPWDRPDDARREAVRSSLLAAVDEGRLPVGRRRWTVGVAFAGGVAAAAIAAIVVWPRAGAEPQHLIDVEASPAAQLEHTTTRTANGDDELVRVHAGKIRIAVGNVRPGDHVHVATGDAEIEGAASYELVAAGDRLTEVTVQAGSAVVRVRGHKPVFLAAGQSWHAAIITTDLSPGSAAMRPDNGSAMRPDSAAAPAGALVDDATTKSTDTRGSMGTTDTMTRAGSSAASSVAGSSSRDATGSTVATTAGSTDSRAASSGTRAALATVSRDAAGTQTGSTSSRNATATPTASTRSRDAAGTSTGPADPAHDATGAHADPLTSRDVTGTHAASTAAVRDVVGTHAGSTISRDSTATHTGSTDPARDAITTTRPPPIALPGAPTRTPTEKHFQSGWALLRAGKSADAAIELGAAADASDGELASDARYFQAVALIRAGHGGEAERALVTFLDHAPRSMRRGRAAVMLGRLIAGRGDKAAARAWFEAALHDADPSVAAAAKAGIDGAR